MFNSDKPIISLEEDLLDRKYFSSTLSNAILSYKQKDSLTIGLYGKWGCGKTSIVNMFINDLERQSENYQIKKPLIIRFFPWNFSDQNQLIEQFFIALYSGLGVANKKEHRNQRIKDIGKYTMAADAAGFIPGFSAIADRVSKLLHDYSDALLNANNETDLLSIKEEISGELLKIDMKIIIIIDDIDRLNNIEIRQVFQLVKSLADFPNTVYLLSFDKDVVINALKDIQKGSGNEYLEKIIQVPIEIPNIDTVKLYNILFYKLDKSISDYSRERRNQEYFAKIIATCVMPFVSTLRDVNRLINVFTFKYDLVRDDVNIVDLIAISSIQVFAPELYQWIYKNKNILIGATDFYKGYVMAKQQEETAALGESIKYIKAPDMNIILGILSALFPAIDQKINYPYQQAEEKELLRTQRIACAEKFDTYFSLSIENLEISKSEINYIIYNYSYQQLFNKLKKFCEQDIVISFLIELQSQIKSIPLDRIPVLLQVMVDISEALKSVKAKVFFEVTAIAYGNLIIIDLLKRYTNDTERFNVLKEVILKAKDEGVPTCAYLLNKIELSHGRLSGFGKKQGEQLISLNHVDEMEMLIIRRIKKLPQSMNVLDLNGFRIISYMWECFDENGFNSYIKTLLKDNINVVKFIAQNANEWLSGDRNKIKGWDFRNNDIEKFISVDDAIIKISESVKSQEFLNLEMEIKRRAIAFMLWNKDEVKGKEITVADVDEELENWKVS